MKGFCFFMLAVAMLAVSVCASAQLPQLPAGYLAPNCGSVSNKSDDTLDVTNKTFSWTYRLAAQCDTTLAEPGRCGYWCSSRVVFGLKASYNFASKIEWWLGGQLRRTQYCWGGVWYDAFPSDSIAVTKCQSTDSCQVGGQRGGS
jgi:hypothetical protein